MNLDIYKCPNCGSSLSFDADQGMVVCKQCRSAFDPKDVESFQVETPSQEGAHAHGHVHGGQTSPTPHAAETSEQIAAATHGYHCDNCGAEVVTEEMTASSFCYYCHSPVILTDRLSGDFAPDAILPFKIGKEQAQQRFLEWAKKYRLIPKGFTSPQHLEKITGIYVPYWMADGSAYVDVEGTGETSTSRTVGDKKYTTIKTFSFKREGTLDIDHVKTLASDKVDQGLINSVESNTKDKLQPFSTAFLSGFFSQRYTIPRADVEASTAERMEQYTDAAIRSTIGPYSSLRYTKNHRDIRLDQWSYVLLPMWILTYQFRQKTYVYALNGETGEFFGELPMDMPRLFRNIGIAFAGIITAAILGGVFIW